jgi:putative endonuclease
MGRVMTSAAAIRARQQHARAAEAEVARLLEVAGFEIVARNLRLGHLELDIVARRNELVIVVEVRSRSGVAWTTGFGSITAQKRRRVRLAAARLWRKRYRSDPSVTRLRIDAAAVSLTADGMRVHYCAGAF